MEEADKKLTLWESVNSEDSDLPPKLFFEINKPMTVVFPTTFTAPKEFGPDEDNYCVFDVKHNDEPARIMTSAWTLLAGLKKFSPLAGKTLIIEKQLKDGKQRFVVAEQKSLKNS